MFNWKTQYPPIHDAPAAPDEIEFAPRGGIALAPRRCHLDVATNATRKWHADKIAFIAEFERRSAELETQREAAEKLQQEFCDLHATRRDLNKQICTGDSKISYAIQTISQIDEIVKDATRDDELDLQRLATERAAQSLLTDSLPAVVEKLKSELTKVEDQIRNFAKANGIKAVGL